MSSTNTNVSLCVCSCIMNGSFYILVLKTFMHPVEKCCFGMTLAVKVVQHVFVDGWSLLIILYIYRLDKTVSYIED